MVIMRQDRMLANAMIAIILQFIKCIKSSHCIPLTYTVFYVNYISISLEKKQQQILLGLPHLKSSQYVHIF